MHSRNATLQGRTGFAQGGLTLAHGIFVGLATIDVVYDVDEFPAANSKVAAHSQEVFVGGPAMNASIAFAHLGGEPTLVTAVGCHALTVVIREELQRRAVRLLDLNPGFGELPVISSISVDRSGRRNIVSANEIRVPALAAEADPKLCAQAGIVLVDGHYMKACQTWAKAARALGTPVVLDGGSWKDGTAELLRSVDTAICSADFLPPGCATEDEVFRSLKDCGVTNIAITRGAEPVRFVSGPTSGTVPVPQVQVVDTMGAGDIFHGAFCFFASTGSGFVEALEGAAKVAAESCRFRGTRDWMKRSPR
jgi:sugar/nucleoside kinase (ribokinase family)